jgi:D-alanine-D-alanine ligase
MIIGITYDLIDDYLAAGMDPEAAAEFDTKETIDGLDDALKSLGHETDRIGNAKSLIGRLARGDRWDFVFNVCEGERGYAREAQVPAILDVYNLRYTFSDPATLTVCLHKGLAKRVVQAAGVPTAPFAEIRDPADCRSVPMAYPLFIKPIAEGTGKGITELSKVDNPADLETRCARLLSEFGQAVLVEGYLPGREFTTGIVGTGRDAKVVGTMEVKFNEGVEAVYSFDTKKKWEERVRYELVGGGMAAEIEKVALAAWNALGCRDGGRMDIRCDAQGVPNFIEVNPLAGLNLHYSDLPIVARLSGIGFNELIGRIMESALKRAVPKP